MLWLCMLSFIRVYSATSIEKLLPFDCLNFNIFSLVSHYFVSNGWNLMRLTFYVYYHSEVMHVKFIGVIAR